MKNASMTIPIQYISTAAWNVPVRCNRPALRRELRDNDCQACCGQEVTL